MNKIQIINDYVVKNEQSLKRLCFRFYGDNDKRHDLFQEFYLKVVSITDERFTKYKDNLRALCYYTIWTIFRDRNKGRSPLRSKIYQPLDAIDIGENREYLKDVTDYIDAQMNKEHNFADIAVFMYAQEESLREISRQTKINIYDLSKYRQAGQKKLQRLLA